PHATPAAVIILAADHGVAEEGVSAYPQEVTAQMVLNFLHEGAAINVLARRAGAHVRVVDMGVKDPAGLVRGHPALFEAGRTSLGPGTANFLHGPALTPAQARQALETGRRVLSALQEREGIRVVALGEMGIGNTTSASALTAAL